jgi:hypothetical protein
VVGSRPLDRAEPSRPCGQGERRRRERVVGSGAGRSARWTETRLSASSAKSLPTCPSPERPHVIEMAIGLAYSRVEHEWAEDDDRARRASRRARCSLRRGCRWAAAV